MTKLPNGSKFSGLLTAIKDREAVPLGEPNGLPDQAKTGVGAQTDQAEAEARAEADLRAGAGQASIRGPGRPRGKRSDPDFEQVTAYVNRRTHQAVKIALLTEGAGREFSELVEQLLADWLGRQGQ